MFIKNSSLLRITGLACLLASCTQQPDDFKDFLNGQELKYPGAITFGLFATDGWVIKVSARVS